MDRVDSPLYHPVSPMPTATLPAMAGEHALGAELVYGPPPDAAIAAGLPVLDDIERAPLPSCLRVYEV